MRWAIGDLYPAVGHLMARMAMVGCTRRYKGTAAHGARDGAGSLIAALRHIIGRLEPGIVQSKEPDEQHELRSWVRSSSDEGCCQFPECAEPVTRGRRTDFPLIRFCLNGADRVVPIFA